MRVPAGLLAVFMLVAGQAMTALAFAQTGTWVCFIEGGRSQPAHFEPNGNVYVGRHATTEGLAWNEAIENCERGEGSRSACQGAMTPGAICRVMEPQRAAAYGASFRRPMNVQPGAYQCEARGTAPLGVLLGWDGQFHSTTDADYQAARRAMEARCTTSTCEPMRCFRRSGAAQTGQNNAGGGTTQPASFPAGNMQYFWRQLGGNWRSATSPIDVQACDFPSSHACDGANARRYGAGQTQSVHVNGCNAPPLQIQCVVEARGTGQNTPATPDPQAQLERFCRDYADHAVNAANRAAQAGCAPNRAFQNDFNPDRALHYNWCLRAPEQRVAAGQQSRQQALDQCLANAGGNSRPTGRYPPGERLLRNLGGWDLREHVRANGSFERCSLTLERHAPANVPRISLFDTNVYVLSLTAHPSLAAGSRIPTRYTVNGRNFDGTLDVHANQRSSIDITAVIEHFAVASDARFPVRDRTYAWFMQGMPQAMTALRECRARFR